MKHSRIFLFLLVISFLAFLPSVAANKVEKVFIPEFALSEQGARLHSLSIDNIGNTTNISFLLESNSTPVEIYSVEYVSAGHKKTFKPLEPFSFSVGEKEIESKRGTWKIRIEFPFTTTFCAEDVLVLHTSRGAVSMPASYEGRMKEKEKGYIEEIARQEKHSRRMRWVLWVVIAVAALVNITVFVRYRRRLLRRNMEMRDMAMLMAERTEKNELLQKRVDALYGSRLDTLNHLCNEYFEKHDSDNVRLSLFNDVEKTIMSLRDSDSVEKLEATVNEYMDGILDRISDQIPDLSRADRLFLTYLYAGFSPRAICLFTGIKVKNFYNRRLRLKKKILESTAPDRELFASRM